MCEQTVLRFHILLREKFANSISVKVIKKCDKSAVMQILAVFGTI